MSQKKSPSATRSVLGKLSRTVLALQDGLEQLCLDPDGRLLSLADDPERLRQAVLAVAGRQPAVSSETVTVPDLPAEALVAVVKEAVGLTYLNPDYAKYAFLRDERGKTYEVLTWKPGYGVSPDAVREHFSVLGFRGNTAAFLEWNRKDHGDGWFVSIPEDDRCFRGSDAGLCAPYFFRDGAGRKLNLGGLSGGWFDDVVFVAFRECLK